MSLSQAARRRGVSSTRSILVSLGLFVIAPCIHAAYPPSVRSDAELGQAVVIALVIYLAWAAVCFLIGRALLPPSLAVPKEDAAPLGRVYELSSGAVVWQDERYEPASAEEGTAVCAGCGKEDEKANLLVCRARDSYLHRRCMLG